MVDPMTKAEARIKAQQMWGPNSIVSIVNDMRYIVADSVGVRGASSESFEKAFEQAALLGERRTIPKAKHG
jgi:hypothetical protein